VQRDPLEHRLSAIALAHVVECDHHASRRRRGRRVKTPPRGANA
jgi:hypothetical protein